MPKVAVVTDSSAMLASEAVRSAGIRVVPLQVVVGARSYADGVDPEAAPARVAEALRSHRRVSTSRPTPASFLEVYRQAAAEGAEEIVSVHLSARVSGTCESALLAARSAPVPVHVVDSRHVGPGTGFAAIAAAEAVEAGLSGAAVADHARERADATVSLFHVASLEYLRRGGRVGAAAALLGTALAVKPILEVRDGLVAPRERVRTSGRALARLEELAVAGAGARPVDVVVCHLAAEAPAQELASRLARRLEKQLAGAEVVLAEVPAVLGAHVGPGLVGVAVGPRLPLPG